MTAALCPCDVPSASMQAALPLRSPQTSLILAELARQRRYERQQRRRARARRAAWLSLFDRRAFDSVCVENNSPRLLFAGAMPVVYAI